MKVLMINGSPERNSCTERALKEIAGTLGSAGIESEIVTIGREVIRGCQACGGCEKLGKCVIDDVVNRVAARLDEYYASGNGTVYSFMDRLFYSAGSRLRYKPAAAIAVARRAGTTATLDTLIKYFTINEMPVVSSTYWNMVHGFTMRNIGHNMAWMLRCIEAGKAAGVGMPASERGHWTHFIMGDKQ